MAEKILADKNRDKLAQKNVPTPVWNKMVRHSSIFAKPQADIPGFSLFDRWITSYGNTVIV